MGSIQIQVGTLMRALGVMFDPKLSWEKHIVHVSNIVKIHALRRISSDLNQSKLVNNAHRSIYSVLYHTSGISFKERTKSIMVTKNCFLKLDCHNCPTMHMNPFWS